MEALSSTLAESSAYEVEASPDEVADQLRPSAHTGEQREEAEPAHHEAGAEARPVVPGAGSAHHLEQIPRAVVDAERGAVGLIGHRVADQRVRHEEDLESRAPGPEREIEVLAVGEELRVE